MKDRACRKQKTQAHGRTVELALRKKAYHRSERVLVRFRSSSKPSSFLYTPGGLGGTSLMLRAGCPCTSCTPSWFDNQPATLVLHGPLSKLSVMELQASSSYGPQSGEIEVRSRRSRASEHSLYQQ